MKEGEPTKGRPIKRTASVKEISAESLAESDGRCYETDSATPVSSLAASIPDDSVTSGLTSHSSSVPTITLIHAGQDLSQSIRDLKVQSCRGLQMLDG